MHMDSRKRQHNRFKIRIKQPTKQNNGRCVKIKNTNFTIFNKDIKHSIEDDVLYIEGIANSGLEDVSGDILTNQAMQQIVEQATDHNLHLNHDKTFKGLLGSIVDAKLTPQGVWIKSRILDEKKQFVENLLNQNINLGQSISGTAKRVKNNNKYITDWQLFEVSLTPFPCDQNTMGTVKISKSLYDVTKELNESIGAENMADENINITEEKVIELINQALAEKTEETEKTIIEKITADIDAKFGAFDERIKSIESQLEAQKDDAAKQDEPGTDDTTNADNGNEETNEEKDGEEKEEEEKDEETTEKSLNAMIQKQINKSIKEMFKPTFNYKETPNVEKAINKNGSTPKELAKQIFN